MKKFIAKFKDQNGSLFKFSITAESLFEADVRAKRMAESSGWLYLDIGAYDN